MPHRFGLFEIGIIVRKHNERECLELMEKWWEEFISISVEGSVVFTVYTLEKWDKI